MIGRVSDVIYEPLMVNNVSFPRKTAPKFHEISNFGCPFSMGNGLLCSEERYPLLLECSIRSLRCIMIMARVSDCLHKPLMVKTMSFLQNTYSQLACKNAAHKEMQHREINVMLDGGLLSEVWFYLQKCNESPQEPAKRISFHRPPRYGKCFFTFL